MTATDKKEIQKALTDAIKLFAKSGRINDAILAIQALQMLEDARLGDNSGRR